MGTQAAIDLRPCPECRAIHLFCPQCGTPHDVAPPPACNPHLRPVLDTHCRECGLPIRLRALPPIPAEVARLERLLGLPAADERGVQ